MVAFIKKPEYQGEEGERQLGREFPLGRLKRPEGGTQVSILLVTGLHYNIFIS